MHKRHKSATAGGNRRQQRNGLQTFAGDDSARLCLEYNTNAPRSQYCEAAKCKTC